MGRVDCIQCSNFYRPIAWDYSARYDARIAQVLKSFNFISFIQFFDVYLNFPNISSSASMTETWLVWFFKKIELKKRFKQFLNAD